MEDVMLSIIVPVYNHENYIEQALNSILNQQISFSYEVIIGEDCSTDESANVIRNLESKFSENFKIIYRKKNKGMFGNISEMMYMAKGRYITVLEADDYWIYRKKIDGQIVFLEENPCYIGYAHDVQLVDWQGVKLDMCYEAGCQQRDYCLKDFLDGILPGQTGSFLYRNIFKNTDVFKYMEHCTQYPLDRFITFVLATEGLIYCGKSKWSAYRYVVDLGSSYSATNNVYSETFANEAFRFHEAIYCYAKEREIEVSIKVAEKLYFKSFCRVWCAQNKSIIVLIKKIRELKYPLSSVLWVIKKYIEPKMKKRGKA